MSHASNMGRHARRSAKAVRSAARHFRDTAEEEANGVVHTIQRAGNDALESVKEGYEGLRDIGKGYERSFERQVEKHPVTSVLAAVGVGFVLGFLYRRI